jgi:hypothetical protein
VAEPTGELLDRLQNADVGGLTPCVITATPSQTAGGIDVEVRPEGDCSGIAIGTTVEISGEPRPQELDTFAALSTWSNWAEARVLAHDIVDLTMWLVYQQIEWDYDYLTVYDGVFPYWQWYDQYWYEVFGSQGGWFNGGYFPHYYAYNYRHAYSDGYLTSAAPDTEGWAQPAIRGYYDGGFTCEFWQTWNDPYPGFHWHNLCRQLS